MCIRGVLYRSGKKNRGIFQNLTIKARVSKNVNLEGTLKHVIARSLPAGRQGFRRSNLYYFEGEIAAVALLPRNDKCGCGFKITTTAPCFFIENNVKYFIHPAV